MDGLYFGVEDDDEGEEAEEHYMEDEEYEPSEQEIVEYCEWLGMDPEHDRQLMWIAREALKAPLPDNWKICYTEDREVYYFNVRSGESIWDHPMDAYYKALFRQEKAKLEKKRKKMRLYSGSFPILPLQEYYSQLSEEEEEMNCVGAAGIDLPDHLTDPIDCRLYVDPVVLPTSGRTVSKHTIVNNKWRDPFSREYIENRRLIPNIDKRNEVTSWLETTTKKHMQTLIAEKSLTAVLKMLPYLLDKECEVSLKTQAILLTHFRKLFTTPASTLSQAVHGHTMPSNGSHPLHDQSSTSIQSCPAPGGVNTSSALDSSDECDFEGNVFDPSSRPDHPSATSSSASNPTVQSNSASSPAKHTVGYLEVVRLSADQINTLLGSLLTMSTTTSAEILYLLLDSVPQLRCAPVLRGFSAEVLNVLRISPSDILHLVTSNAGSDFRSTAGTSGGRHPIRHGPPPPAHAGNGRRSLSHPHHHHLPNTEFGYPLSRRPGTPSSDEEEGTPGTGRETDRSSAPDGISYDIALQTQNTDHLICLKWILLLMDVPMHMNILERTEWEIAVHVLILIFNSIPDSAKSRIGLLCRLLRGLKGWPLQLSTCPPTLLQWFVDLTLLDSNPWHQILLLYDLLINGAEGAAECIKTRKDAVVQALFRATEFSCADVDTEQSITYASMLGALLVFLDCCKLSDFSSSRALELSIAYDLFPRLTRQQWRPRHFEQTVLEILACIAAEPAMAWAIMGSKAVEFLIKELSKKKKNSEALRMKLETTEGTEKRLQASNSIVNWALMYLKLNNAKKKQTSELVEELIRRNERKRQELASERVNNLVVLLQTLMAVRLKPKQTRDRGGGGAGPTPSSSSMLPGDRKPSSNDGVMMMGDTYPVNGSDRNGKQPDAPPTPANMPPPNPNRRRGGRGGAGVGENNKLLVDPTIPQQQQQPFIADSSSSREATPSAGIYGAQAYHQFADLPRFAGASSSSASSSSSVGANQGFLPAL